MTGIGEKLMDTQTFVTPPCPLCTPAVRCGHMSFLEPSQIETNMAEVTEFLHPIQRSNVLGVPRKGINDPVAIR
jgi:hypothetical protein